MANGIEEGSEAELGVAPPVDVFVPLPFEGFFEEIGRGSVDDFVEVEEFFPRISDFAVEFRDLLLVVGDAFFEPCGAGGGGRRRAGAGCRGGAW